jgi:hypothetical protein
MVQVKFLSHQSPWLPVEHLLPLLVFGHSNLVKASRALLRYMQVTPTASPSTWGRQLHLSVVKQGHTSGSMTCGSLPSSEGAAHDAGGAERPQRCYVTDPAGAHHCADVIHILYQ